MAGLTDDVGSWGHGAHRCLGGHDVPLPLSAHGSGQQNLSQCGRPQVVKHGKCHVAHLILSTLHHLQINAERRRKLSRLQGVILFKAVDKHLERRDHSGTIGCDDFTLGRQFPLRPPCDLSTLGGAVRLIEQQPLTLSSVNPSGCPWIRGHLGKYASCRVPRSLPRLNRLGPPRFAWGP
jgi:hypothetical protein